VRSQSRKSHAIAAEALPRKAERPIARAVVSHAAQRA
jgi:hypothetical protein